MNDGSLVARLSYKTALIPDSQASLITRQFEALLVDIIEHPNHASEYPDLPTDLTSVISASVDQISSDVCLLHQFVERQAALTPSAIALEFAHSIEEESVESFKWTYDQLNQEANRIANYLISMNNLKPNDKIATCFDKCPQASFAFIGILKAGCSFLALDPSAPIERKQFICADAGVTCVLTNDPLLSELSTIDVPILSVTTAEFLESSPCDPNLPFKIQPENISYCLYTSGSTGQPKGCMLTHENAVQGMLAFQEQFSGTWSSESKFLQVTEAHWF